MQELEEYAVKTDYKCLGNPKNRDTKFKPQPMRYPAPLEALNSALNKIESDGSVKAIDKETGKQFYFRPSKRVPLRRLPDESWADKLLNVADNITDLCEAIGVGSDSDALPHEKERIEWKLEHAAHYLSAFCHDREFLEKAASLVKIDSETGLITPPQLPIEPSSEEEFRVFRGYKPHSLRLPSNR